MISQNTMELLHQAIKEYDKLKGKDYLVFYRSGRNEKLLFNILRLQQNNFWHLLGVGYDFAKKQDCPKLYELCLNEQNINEFLVYMHDNQTCMEKYKAFMRVFNFIENTKIVDIGNTNCTPDKQNFDYAIGTKDGIIGYGKDKTTETCFPKTAQLKNIDNFNNIKDFVFIFSKNIDALYFDKLEYSVSKNKEIILSIFEEVKNMDNFIIFVEQNGMKLSTIDNDILETLLK